MYFLQNMETIIYKNGNFCILLFTKRFFTSEKNVNKFFLDEGLKYDA